VLGCLLQHPSVLLQYFHTGVVSSGEKFDSLMLDATIDEITVTVPLLREPLDADCQCRRQDWLVDSAISRRYPEGLS